jgi:glutathione S-transferase
LQIGSDIYIDCFLIAQKLERLFPEPSIFPNGNAGMPQALMVWADAFFEAGLHMAIHDLSHLWDDAFSRDREGLFERLDFAAVKARFPEACVDFRSHAALIDAQLSDGRAFLQGARPGLADIHAWPTLWFSRAMMPIVENLLAPFTHLKRFEANMAALGEGSRQEITAAEAHSVARSTSPAGGLLVDAADPLCLTLGQQVTVAPVSSRRGDSTGILKGLTIEEVVISHTSPEAGEVHVHFPRLGYEVKPA